MVITDTAGSVKRLLSAKRGQGIPEYSILVVLVIAIASAVFVNQGPFDDALKSAFDFLASTVSSVP